MHTFRQRTVAVALTFFLSASLAGCTTPQPDAGAEPTASSSARAVSSGSPSPLPAATIVDDETATWLAQQSGVLDAHAERRAGRDAFDVYVDLDPDITDEALISLTDEVTARLPTSIDGDGDSAVWYSLGEGREFSSLGGAYTRDFFLNWRRARTCDTISARGGGPETGNRFLLRCPRGQEGWLSQFLHGHVNAEGFEEDLAPRDPEIRYVTVSMDGRFEAETAPFAGTDDSAGITFSLKDPIDIRSARLVNDGSGEHLHIVAGDDDAKARILQAYEDYPYRDETTEFTVEVAGD